MSEGNLFLEKLQNGGIKGEKAARRAEILASMDCIMHNLRSLSTIEQWTMNALPWGFDWHVLDYDREKSEERVRKYVEEIEKMDDNQFYCIANTFVSLMYTECFSTRFSPGCFSFNGQEKSDAD